MRAQKLLIILAAAVLLSAAVLSAGCVSSNGIEGTWYADDTEGIYKLVFNADGTGLFTAVGDSKSDDSVLSRTETPFTWVSRDSGIITITYDGKTENGTVDKDYRLILMENGLIYGKRYTA